MSVPPPQRPPATRPTSNIRPAGIGASYALNPTPQGRAAGYIPVAPLGHTEVIANAPTLGQFWRSDIRRTTGGRRPRWAGLAAFWIGVGAIAFLVLGAVTGIETLRAIALPLSAVAGFFAIIALIAGVGRVLGFFGLLFALAGNIVVIDWLVRLFS
ncbi:MAG: hypothetical protein M3N46_13595 [Actinomycetota bacterium]|nr:hypothetical protein [Actinomycetota bacterium]